jgi:hypothetical protein
MAIQYDGGDMSENAYKSALYRIRDKPFSVIGLLLILIPPLVALYYIYSFRFDVLTGVDWNLMPMVERALTGTLTVRDLFTPDNEHVMFFPKLLLLVDVYLFHYKMAYICYFNWAFIAAAMALTLKAFYDQNKDYKLAILQFLPVPMIMFNFNQWNTLLFGTPGLQVNICDLGLILSLYCLYRARGVDRYFLLAIFAGMMATFSFMVGLLAWPLGLILILWTGQDKIKMSLYWLTAAGASILWYFYNTWDNAGSTLTVSIHNDVLASVEYAVVQAGAFFSSSVSQGMFFGAVLLLVLAALLWSAYKGGQLRSNSLWIMYILLMFGVVACLTIGRTSTGLETALSSRYIPYKDFGIIGIYLLAASLYNKKALSGIVPMVSFGVLSVIIIYGIIAGYVIGLETGKDLSLADGQYGNVLYHYDSMSDDDLNVLWFHDKSVLRERIQVAEKYRLNVFYDGRS